MEVVFKNRMRKSYRVEVPAEFKIKNERGAHVETPTENLEGKSFLINIQSRREKRIRDNQVAVMYDIDGVMNGRYPAHITAYFGDAEEAHLY